MPPDLEVAVACAEERATLANLLQFYIHDFSEHWSGTSQGELEIDGRFFDYPLDIYWTEPGRVPLLFRLNEKLVGFALLNAHGQTGRSVDRNMAEFFVVRKHRGAGVGRAAAHAIFDRYPGRWETAVARRNVRALPFWRDTIRGHPAVEDVEELDLRTDTWNGALFGFRVTAGPA